VRALFGSRECPPEEQLTKNTSAVISVWGALGQLKLKAQAFEHLPLARVKAVFEKYLPGGEMSSPSGIMQLIGTAPINVDVWPADSYVDLVRCGSDCESAPRPPMC